MQAIGRHLPLFLPALAVTIVAVVVLDVGKTRPVRAARLRGGPTEGARSLSYRLAVIERDGQDERAVRARAVTVDARLAGGETLTWRGTLDDEGGADVVFPRRDAPVEGDVAFEVRMDGERTPIAESRVRLSPDVWAARAKRRGGWVQHREGPLVVRVAAGRGVFAVPFRDPLFVDVTRDGARFLGTVSCECGTEQEGSRLLRADPRATLPVKTFVTPLEHATAVRVVARDTDGVTATLDATLAVIPGAIHAVYEGGVLRVTSPISRERAYVAIVSETERITGAVVALAATSRGTAEGGLPLALPETSPLWAVVSSEPDFTSGAAVGWPIRGGGIAEPPSTFDVSDVLVVDAAPARVEREFRRATRARLSAALAAVSSMALAALLVVRGARASEKRLEAHLAEVGVDRETTARVSQHDAIGLIGVAVLCLLLGAALIGVFAAWS